MVQPEGQEHAEESQGFESPDPAGNVPLLESVSHAVLDVVVYVSHAVTWYFLLYYRAGFATIF